MFIDHLKANHSKLFTQYASVVRDCNRCFSAKTQNLTHIDQEGVLHQLYTQFFNIANAADGKKEHLTDDNFETLRALKINYEAITEPFTFYEQLTAITLELADDVSSLTEEALKEKVNAFEQKLKQIDEEIKNYNARNTIATASEQANGIVDDANGQLRLLHRDLRNENNNISATNHTLRTMSILAMVGGGVLLLVGLILANPMIIGVGAGMGIVGAGCFFHFNSKCNQQQAGSSYIPTEAGNTPPAASN